MKQDDPIYAREFGTHGTRFNPSIKALAQWEKAPHTEKPRLLYGVEEKVGDEIVRTLKDTSTVEATKISLHVSFFAKAIIEEEERKHDILKKHDADLFASFNKLYIENAKLKKELAKRDVASIGVIEEQPQGQQVQVGNNESESVPSSLILDFERMLFKNKVLSSIIKNRE